MKIKLPVLFLAVFLAGSVFSQEPILLSYQRNFVRASLAAKPGILRDAATDRNSGEFIGALYEFALQFVLDNSVLLWGDSDLVTLTTVATRGLRSAGYRNSSETLWKVFLSFQDPYSRVEILETLTSFGKDPQFIYNLNQFLISQNGFYHAGYAMDYPTLTACISALGTLGDISSYIPLFSAFTAGYPQNINSEIQKALDSLEGNYRLFLNDILRSSPADDKLAALRLVTGSAKLGSQERGELAQTALEISLDLASTDSGNNADINALRYNAVQVLTGLRWTRASPHVIQHFYRVQSDFQNNLAPKDRFLEAITCLGAMGTFESSQVLALQLGYYNSRTEYSGEYDSDIILTLVQALGDIGDKAAFDYLLYISYLNYPEHIQIAARDALNRLRW